jgi:HAMP domain-containing protein
MATVAPWRISLRLHITLALLTAVSATGSALYVMYQARPSIGGGLPQHGAASGGALLLGAVLAGVLAALLGLGFGMVTSRRIRELIRRTEVLVQTDMPHVPRSAADELGVLEEAFGRLTLSIDRFVRDSAILSCLAQGMLLIGRGGELVDYNTAAEGILGTSLAPYAGKGMWGQDGLCPEGPENGRLKDLCQQAMGRAEAVAGGEMHVRLGPAGVGASRLLEVSLRSWQGGKEEE